jgi:hypothetical protein
MATEFKEMFNPTFIPMNRDDVISIQRFTLSGMPSPEALELVDCCNMWPVDFERSAVRLVEILHPMLADAFLYPLKREIDKLVEERKKELVVLGVDDSRTR